MSSTTTICTGFSLWCTRAISMWARVRPCIIFPLVVFSLGTAGAQDYRIGPQDVLEIKVLGDQEMDRTVVVSGKGMINFPFVGFLEIEGMTVEEVTGILAEKLGECCLVDPQISVRVVEFHGKRVYLFGEVQKPGVYQLAQGKTLMQLIIEAEGFTRKAARNRVYILRKGEDERIKADVEEIIKDPEKDIPLSPGDVVYVPESIF